MRESPFAWGWNAVILNIALTQVQVKSQNLKNSQVKDGVWSNLLGTLWLSASSTMELLHCKLSRSSHLINYIAEWDLKGNVKTLCALKDLAETLFCFNFLSKPKARRVTQFPRSFLALPGCLIRDYSALKALLMGCRSLAWKPDCSVIPWSIF